ncbi:helix-turn-helix domain-containing protein [Alkalibacterium olivapovliticus]|uniref:Helix-turn-helix protein n=1 Tax=Alkalibacterium olivapovliticus TaxID=99907 RepID=A0A2T0W5E5_9LACT|nr:helix-turn-helix transcriptional regulator [Alkalibacterium olivapovliticus]PRY81001.1 helix-turn-helix protein [Alkalibacterium olivapovliticus]
MEENKPFSVTLRELRKMKKLTLVELAKRANTSNSYLSQLENEKRNPPKPELIKNIAIGLSGNDKHEESTFYDMLMKSAGYDQSSLSKEDSDKEDLYSYLSEYGLYLYRLYLHHFKEIYSVREVSRIKNSVEEYISENFSDTKNVTKQNLTIDKKSAEDIQSIKSISNGKEIPESFIREYLFTVQVEVNKKVLKMQLESALNMLARSTNQNYNLISYFGEMTDINERKINTFETLVKKSLFNIDEKGLEKVISLNNNLRNTLVDMNDDYKPVEKTDTSINI